MSPSFARQALALAAVSLLYIAWSARPSGVSHRLPSATDFAACAALHAVSVAAVPMLGSSLVRRIALIAAAAAVNVLLYGAVLLASRLPLGLGSAWRLTSLIAFGAALGSVGYAAVVGAYRGDPQWYRALAGALPLSVAFCAGLGGWALFRGQALEMGFAPLAVAWWWGFSLGSAWSARGSNPPAPILPPAAAG